MIPVSLYMKNFLSYGEDVPPLDFTQFDVACLSGNNGHGKSAVLDAMTWALWGQARKATGEKSPEEGLLRIGATDMQVELEFDLEGDRYRVLRKFQRRRKKRSSSLEFQVFDGAANAYKSLTERRIRKTQQKINATLRMTYETFINSAFILQGRVDEFTQKTPHKRKEVFADILDLSRYTQLAELAKEHRNTARQSRDMLADQLKGIEAELEHKPEYEQTLAELQRNLADLEVNLQASAKQLQEVEEQYNTLRSKAQQVQEKQRQHTQIEADVKRLDARQKTQQHELETLQKLLEQAPEIEQQHARYLELEQQKVDYDEKLQRLTAYQKQQYELTATISKSRQKVEKECDAWQAKQTQARNTLQELQHLLDQSADIEKGFQELQEARAQDEAWEETRNRITELKSSADALEKRIAREQAQLHSDLKAEERRAAELQRCADLQAAREADVTRWTQRVAELQDLEQEKTQSRECGLELKANLDLLKSQQTRLEADAEELRERYELLQRSSAAPRCPLCNSDLDAHKKGELEAHFQQKIQAAQDEIKAIQQSMKDQDRQITAQRKRHRQILNRLKKLDNARESSLQAEHALRESQQAAQELTAFQERIAALRKRLESNDFAPDERAELAALEQDIAACAYDAKAHQALKKRLKQLNRFEGDHARLESAREQQRKVKESLPPIEAEIQTLQRQLEEEAYAQEARAALQTLLTQIEELGYDDAMHTQVQHDLQDLRDVPARKVAVDQARGRIDAVQHALNEVLTERQQKGEWLRDLQTQIEMLQQEVIRLPQVEQTRKTLQAQREKAMRQRDELLHRRGIYESKCEHCQTLEQEKKALQTRQQQAEKDRQLYGQLTQIFGKDGIQAYLIENAIPEIEEEANEILAKLTNNRTHIAIESVKDLHSGGHRETLDIKISDELGTRSYELYSGGEAFRVNFAIRIALSKLLANRAGTKLKTLVIDEGFGTQDVQGLEQLVEAIKAISMDFEKILVITHLEGLKDAFPVRIEVVKHPDTGSQYEIIY